MSTRGGRRQLAATLQLRRQQPLHLSTTPATTMDIRQAIRGHKPTQAKSLSLGEYVFPTDITFRFTHTHCQMSVLILFHCNIHVSLTFFFLLSLVCLLNLKKNQKKLVSLLFMLVVELKRKPKNISRSSFYLLGAFPCKQFLFLFLSLGVEKTILKMLSGSYMHYCLSNLEPILLVFSLELNACRFQLSPMHVHSYYYTHHSVVQVKGNNDDI